MLQNQRCMKNFVTLSAPDQELIVIETIQGEFVRDNLFFLNGLFGSSIYDVIWLVNVAPIGKNTTLASERRARRLVA